MYGMLFLFTKIVVKQQFLMFSQSPLENLHTLNDCIGCVNKNVYKIMTCLHTYVVVFQILIMSMCKWHFDNWFGGILGTIIGNFEFFT